MNNATAHDIHDKVREVAEQLAERARAHDFTDTELDDLDSDDGLIVDGVAAWKVDGQIRTFTRSVDSDAEAEHAVDIWPRMLRDGDTGDLIRVASAWEATLSLLQADRDGGYGFILVEIDGQQRKCYVA